jgi:hypothetical protein
VPAARLRHSPARIALPLAAALLPLRALADPSPASPAPTPTPPPAYVTAENEFSPSYYGESGNSNQINLRAQIPYDNSRWTIRLKLPVVTKAPVESVTGAGDLTVHDLAVINGRYGQWLAGVVLYLPTASDSLGSHKYSLGPAFGYATDGGPWTFGLSAESYFSVIGPASYPSVGKSKVAPVLRLALSRGWGVGLSTMQFTYDWRLNRWTDVPLGLRIEKRAIAGLGPLGAYVDVERNLVHAADTPGWTIRSALRWSFTRSP